MELTNIASLFQSYRPVNIQSQPLPQFSLPDAGDIRDPFSNLDMNRPLNFGSTPSSDFGFNQFMGNSGSLMGSANQLLLMLLSGLNTLSNGNSGMQSFFNPTATNPNSGMPSFFNPAATNPGGSRSPGSPADQPPQAPSGTPPSTPSTDSPPSDSPGNHAANLEEAKRTTNPKFMPIHRGEEDEKAQNAMIYDQASFGRAADKVALEYGLDPNLFRAMLQKESGAFSRDYRDAMKHVGDTDRAAQDNASLGLGQISRQFLGDDGKWRDGGPVNPRVGGQPVSVEDYNNSAILQLRVAAANLAMRIEDHGGVENGLRYYVSGNASPNPTGDAYVAAINEIMQNKDYMTIGR
ncbi:MAG TPA: FmdB family transcriptional regulator [Noviherbaspirillum sp.]|jgi:hypothetical protein|uniref:FmdB family transcriptional regulator n=1 Tax=Noviherbaspirillum sp. TaxID=1926288 RepID=UPI002DDCED3A|nr:FmdB family transcriptional regulator [Noviherbaspirillum sp.]HEV2610974.1 FmdB family transcriptional regulator [Noviherbaspirillum sp.]